MITEINRQLPLALNVDPLRSAQRTYFYLDPDPSFPTPTITLIRAFAEIVQPNLPFIWQLILKLMQLQSSYHRLCNRQLYG